VRVKSVEFLSSLSDLKAKVGKSDVRVAICIGTFRRRELLREALAGLARLTFRKVATPEIEIIVVDNDSSGSAKEICRTATLPYPIRYIAESKRGIVHVRNRALAEAGAANFIVFLDDDEVPSEAWLDELLATQARFGADVVSGPVLPSYAPGIAEWVKRGGFFVRPNRETGSPLEFCSTNNVLMRNEVLGRVPRFDDRFQLTGGEDTQFFLRVQRVGCKIIWSQEAIVHESVPKERATFGWILRRGYQSGNSWALSEMSLDAALRIRALRFVKGCTHLLVGLTSALVCLCFGKAAFTRALRKACLGAGMLTGLVGSKFLAYQSAAGIRIDEAPEFIEPTSA
jgi:glycosyltransferase involved in cell wall biosynthesis